MRFEWNEAKSRTNFRKHGVWLEEARTVWADGRSVEFYDPEHSDAEDRFIRIGHSTRPLRDPDHFRQACDEEGGAPV